MSIFERTFTALLMLAALATSPARAIAAAGEVASEPKVESYQIQTRIGGKTVTTFIHLFPESPLENPELLQQIRTLNLDHVAFVSEAEQQRAPGNLNDAEELRQRIESETEVPVVQVRARKGFFARIGEMWKTSFRNPEHKPNKSELKYGIVSTVYETTMFSAMVFTTGDIPLENGLMLVGVQTMLSVVNNIYYNAVNHFISRSLKDPSKPASDRTYFFRNLTYDWLTSQAFKVVQSAHALITWGTQSTIAMNTLMSGAGEVQLTNATYRGFEGSRARSAKVNFYVSAFSSVLGLLDLMQHNFMPVLFEVGSYDFRLSGAILLGYYAGTVFALKKYPEQVYTVIDRLHRGLKGAGNWMFKQGVNCAEAFKPKGRLASRNSVEPPQN